MDADVIVVGGGIGGTVAAELLQRGGKSVIVLEKSKGPPDWVRPEILWPATKSTLASLLPAGELEKEGALPLNGVTLSSGGKILLAITREKLDELAIQPWSTNPNQTRELLLRHGTFELRRGMEVTAVLKDGDVISGVRAREADTGAEHLLRAPLTVGDDGAHSLVRAACGIEMSASFFPLDFLCLGFDWPASLPEATGRVFINSSSRAADLLGLVAVPLPEGKGAGVVPVRPRVFEHIGGAGHDPQDQWRRFKESDGLVPVVVGERRFPDDFVRVRRPWGHAPHYGGRGAVLLGDAAHPVSPVGGQGANMSVADAAALAPLVLEGRPDFLAEYERRRRPANERSLLFTRRSSAVLGYSQWLPAGAIPATLVRLAGGAPFLVERLLRYASTAFLEREAAGKE